MNELIEKKTKYGQFCTISCQKHSSQSSKKRCIFLRHYPTSSIFCQISQPKIKKHPKLM